MLAITRMAKKSILNPKIDKSFLLHMLTTYAKEPKDKWTENILVLTNSHWKLFN